MHATKKIGRDEIVELMPQLDSKVFSRDVFAKTGIFVVRQVIPTETLREWQTAWKGFTGELQAAGGRSVNRFNPVSVDEAPPPILADMHKHPALLDVIEQAFGPDIALYNQRFVIKDASSRTPVFLHQDFCYHKGWPSKLSAFVALSPMNPDNGGMVFYPGTHQFGYLGDAGQINPDILEADWPTLAPSLEPGDVAFMNSCTWHSSGPHVSGPDRVLADIIYQPADDPSGVALLRGQWQTDIFLSKLNSKDIFTRSRSSTMGELQRKVEQLESERAAVAN